MKQKEQGHVADFVIRNMPKSIVKGLGVLENLQFPINDKYSFECQIKDISTKVDKGDKPIIETIMGQFRVQDFPILSIENAFEKYWNKFQPFPYPFPLFPLPPIEPPVPDFPERPSACEVYFDTFPREAADCACRTYSDAIRKGYNELQATIIGHFAGNSYDPRLGCR